LLTAASAFGQAPEATPAPNGQGTPAEGRRLSGPYTHENLTVFLIHGPDRIKDKVYLTLSEALEQKKAIVHETQNVNQLSIENLSGEEILVQAGDIVKGGQQDRILAFDLIIPAKTGKEPVKVAIASFCCEAGRWTRRGNEEVARFTTAAALAPTNDLKIAVRKDMAQRAVWANVEKLQTGVGQGLGKSVKAPASETSLQLSLEDKDLQKVRDAYFDTLKAVADGKDDAIGYVAVINGKVNNADVYVSGAMFRKVWPGLLKASAVEAFSQRKKDQKIEPIQVAAVQKFLAEAEAGKAAAKDVNERVRLLQRENDKGIVFETCDRSQPGVLIRQSYLAK
jgi:hypothetical protein